MDGAEDVDRAAARLDPRPQVQPLMKSRRVPARTAPV